jgi:hypothetical protein
MDGACAAQGSATAKLGASHAQLIAQHPQQGGVCFGIGLCGLAVDLKIHAHQSLLKAGL